MENNSIEDLFKKGLAGFERKPSPEAWKRLEQQRSETRSLRWAWYVAAGIAVAFMTGYLLMHSDPAGLRQPVADRAEIKPAEEQSPRIVREKEVTDLSKNPVAIETQKQKRKPAEFNIQSQQNEVHETLPVEEPGADHEIARTNVPSEALKTPETNEIKNDTNNPVIETAAKQQETVAVNRTIVVNVSSTDTLVEPKMSRFARVFRQLKNARAGERVDWEEVGINPRHVLARAEAKLKQ